MTCGLLEPREMALPIALTPTTVPETPRSPLATGGVSFALRRLRLSRGNSLPRRRSFASSERDPANDALSGANVFAIGCIVGGLLHRR